MIRGRTASLALLAWTVGWSLACTGPRHPLRGGWEGRCTLLIGPTMDFDLGEADFDNPGTIYGFSGDPVPEPIGEYDTHRTSGLVWIGGAEDPVPMYGDLVFCQDEAGCSWPPDREDLAPNYFRFQLSNTNGTSLALEGVYEEDSDTLKGPCYDAQYPGTFEAVRTKEDDDA